MKGQNKEKKNKRKEYKDILKKTYRNNKTNKPTKKE